MERPSRSHLNQVGHAELVGLVLELLKRVEQLEAENAALRKENAALKKRCEKLEAQVRESKRLGHQFRRGLRRRSGRSPGGKPERECSGGDLNR